MKNRKVFSHHAPVCHGHFKRLNTVVGDGLSGPTNRKPAKKLKSWTRGRSAKHQNRTLPRPLARWLATTSHMSTQRTAQPRRTKQSGSRCWLQLETVIAALTEGLTEKEPLQMWTRSETPRNYRGKGEGLTRRALRCLVAEPQLGGTWRKARDSCPSGHEKSRRMKHTESCTHRTEQGSNPKR